ncbi:MFS transporter [Helicobacter pylori]|uniref:MFS transporter n=1 Tax=Helicobacter pylori TaxID=210 RepID=UPI0018D10D42|nr:MFS transporter [Helicobacter pylori]
MKHLGKKEVRTLGLSSLGGTLEFYDFIIFVFFTSIIAKHFFPNTLSPIWSEINTYGIFAAGYLARPLGGIVMAHFGDRFGRKNMFMLSILLMVIPTFALALMPTFNHLVNFGVDSMGLSLKNAHYLGYIAPVFLVFVRICQGVAVGGELPGAWVFVHEHAPQGQKNTYIGFLTASVVSGILLGSLVYIGIYMVFDKPVVEDWAWRVAFGLGGIFGIISVYLRRFLEETPVFQQMKQDDTLVKFPLKEVFKNSLFGISISMLITWVLTACILIFILFVPNFTLTHPNFHFTPFEKTYFQILGLVGIVSSIIFTGFLADKIKPHKVCMAFSVAFGFFGFLFFKEFYSNAPSLVNTIVLYFLACFCAGIMNFCPIFMSDVFSARIRFSGISFAYNIAYAITAGFTPQLSSWLNAKAIAAPESLQSYGLSFYIFVVALIAFIVSLLMAPIYNKSNTQHEVSPTA